MSASGRQPNGCFPHATCKNSAFEIETMSDANVTQCLLMVRTKKALKLSHCWHAVLPASQHAKLPPLINVILLP
jgi:hypothetical protein